MTDSPYSADRPVQRLDDALANVTVVPSNYPPEVEAALSLLTPPLVRLMWEALGAADRTGDIALTTAADEFIATLATAPEMFFRAAKALP
jgi:hypothetical protein